jgi:uncharacterized SAM-binding protein YcdF (DUF218 family)
MIKGLTLPRLFLLSYLAIFLLPTIIFGSTFAYVVSQSNGDAEFPADCAIVFGAAVTAIRNTNGSVVAEVAGPGIKRRVSTAAELWRTKKVNRLFLSGGTGQGMGRSEADAMRETAEKLGVDTNSIVLEDQSTSTWENLQNTRPLTERCSSVVGISDGYHLARIEYLASKMDWDLATYPSSMHADRAFTLVSLVRESFGLLYYSLL